MDGVNFELFEDVYLGARPGSGNGCARPLGRVHTPRRRRGPAVRPRRPLTAAMLAERRQLLHAELGNVTLSLRRIGHGARVQLGFQEITNDALERVMMRLVRLERAAGVVEAPQAPRTDRRRPLARTNERPIFVA